MLARVELPELGASSEWAAFSSSALAKGLLGIALPGLVMLLYMLVTRDFRILRRSRPALGLLLIAFIAVPSARTRRVERMGRFFFLGA